MSQEQIDHSPDLKRLEMEGYEIEINNGNAIVSHIPYVNNNGVIKLGKLISPLQMQNNITKYNNDHVIMFAGEYPCNIDKTPIEQIRHASVNSIVSGVQVNYKFSNKPNNGYKDYYEKITNYANIISAPAIALDSSQTVKTFEKNISIEDDIFEYVDTNSARAEIDALSSKVEKCKIGIIGLGGTGSYILDLISKTPVREIHIFDGDNLKQHNCFRMPSPPAKEILTNNIKKTTYLKNTYSKMHKGIIEHSEYINNSNIDILSGLDFVFISIDDGISKNAIVEKLKQCKIPFIDTGIGLNKNNNKLNGNIRTSFFDYNNYEETSNYIDFSTNKDDIYSTNIQIAEMNALNAILAVIKWKKHIGIYENAINKNIDIYTIETGEVVHED